MVKNNILHKIQFIRWKNWVIKLEQYNTKVSCEAQSKLCENRELPCFSPENGICWNCHKNIYSKNGFTVKEASNTLITYCPFCHYSFLE